MHYGCYLPVLAGFVHFLARPNRRKPRVYPARYAVSLISPAFRDYNSYPW